MYHVSTMIPKEGNTALQHIGNDEVHVAWIENSTPYDPNIITKQVWTCMNIAVHQMIR